MLVVHIAVAAFLVLGQFLIMAGGVLGVRWVRNLRFRLLHLSLMVYVAVQTSLGGACPLTVLEQTLRQRSGQPTYRETFTEHWLSPLLFFNAPHWVFTSLHVLAALIIVATWVVLPPAWSTPELQQE